jgi:apolipoprotein N-acyltransferase
LKSLPLPVRLLLAATLGLATPLGFAPYDQSWLPPLLLAALLGLAADTGWRRATAIGGLYGIGLFGHCARWVHIAIQVHGDTPGWLSAAAAALLCLYLALYPAAVLGLSEFSGLLRSALGWIGVPALWLLGELLRGKLLWGAFPWFALGYSQLDTPLARLAPAVGVYGISAVIVWIAYALYAITSSNARHRTIELVALFAPALVLFLPRPGAWTEPVGRPVSTAVVQAGVSESKLNQPGMADLVMARYRALTFAHLNASLIVWPEQALPQPLQRVEVMLLPDLRQVLRAHATTLLFGTFDAEQTNLGTPLFHNSAAAAGMTEARYDKRHLAPFGDFSPMPKFMRRVMESVGAPPADITAGSASQPLMQIGEQRVAVMIGGEDAFGAEFRGDARRAGYLIDLGNDAAYRRSHANNQHLAIACMRAIEYGREVVRSTGTGISAFIGADGTIHEQSELFTETVLQHDVQPRKGVTPYMHWGNAPLWWISGLISTALIGFALLKRPQATPRS